MGFKLDLTGDEIKSAQGGFQPLQEGTYGASIYTAELKKSKAGNWMYQIDFKITEGPEGIGRKQRGWFVLSGKGLFKLIELNKATNKPYPDSKTPAGEFEFPDADEYLGIPVNIVLTKEPYDSDEDDVIRDKDDKPILDEDGNTQTLLDDDGNPVPLVKYQNNIKRVLAYDESKISGADEGEEDKGLFL